MNRQCRRKLHPARLFCIVVIALVASSSVLGSGMSSQGSRHLTATERALLNQGIPLDFESLAKVAKEHESPRIRRQSVHVLGRLRDVRAIDVLMGILETDDDLEVRLACLEGLVLLGQEGALRRVRNLYDSGSEYPAKDLARILVNSGDLAGCPEIISRSKSLDYLERLNSGFQLVQCATAELEGDSRDLTATTAFELLSRDTRREVREYWIGHAIRPLRQGRLAAERFIPRIEEMAREDPNESVREAAAAALRWRAAVLAERK